jgi:hypothetical protein
MKASAGLAQAALFDDGPGYALAGAPLTITVYARGSLARPVRLTVQVLGGGKLSKTELTIPAGPNGQDTYIYTPAADEVARLRYRSDGQLSGQVPPPRTVYSLADPVAYAAGHLNDAAMAIVAKYSACHWNMADAYTDYVLGAPAADAQVVRAVADSGYGSSPGNAMEMLNWINTDSPAMGAMALPVMRVVKGRKSAWYRGWDTFGLWCKKTVPEPGTQPHPKNRAPYNLEDAHFVLAAVRLEAKDSTGLVFQASRAEESQVTELALRHNQPVVRWKDAKGQSVELVSPNKLALNKPAVLTLTSAPQAQALRVNSAEVGRSEAVFAPSVYSQMLIGWGYANYYPQNSFTGHIYALITGKGAPTEAELAVLERYLGAISRR